MSHKDTVTPLGSSDSAILSINWRRGKAAAVGWCNVWRIGSKEMLVAVAATWLFADCDNMDHT